MAEYRKTRTEALHAFVREHTDGWHHGEWEALLADLHGRGLLRPGEEEALGRELEFERVRWILAELDVTGLGPKRRNAVATAFPRAWELFGANAADFAALPTVPSGIASTLAAALSRRGRGRSSAG